MTRLHHRPLLLLVAIAALAACSPDPEPPPTGGIPAVTLQEAANARYASEYAESGVLQLVDGHYEDSDLVVADLDPLSARGDLDGDGREEFVVLLLTGSGGTGVFRDLYVLQRDASGAVSMSAPVLLGDRVDVNALRIERGEIVVDLVVQGENDPLCCPSQPVTYRFRMAGRDGIVETTGQRRVYLRQ